MSLCSALMLTASKTMVDRYHQVNVNWSGSISKHSVQKLPGRPRPHPPLLTTVIDIYLHILLFLNPLLVPVLAS